MTDPMGPVPGPAPGPSTPLFPEAAVPGAPPPPLPADPLPLFDLAVPYVDPQVVDPALDDGVEPLEPWVGRLAATPPPPWSVARLLVASGPWRHSPGPNPAFYDEAPLEVTVARLPERSLNPVDQPVPLTSRLRMLHRRLLSPVPWYPVGADWYELGGQPAVLDRFVRHPGHPVSGFSLATELSPDDGLLALGQVEPSRSDALTRVGMPLATTVRAHGEGLVWGTPPRWVRLREELQLSTDRLRATARLRPLPHGAGLEQWTQVLYDEAPFLRDLRPLADREVTVPGLEAARLQRFDWQPSAMDRVLTTVVAGVTGDLGFSFVFEVPLAADDDVLLADPDEILGWVVVGP